jgi:hypothetical protein
VGVTSLPIAPRVDLSLAVAQLSTNGKVMLAAAVNWRKLAGSAEEAEKTAKPE